MSTPHETTDSAAPRHAPGAAMHYVLRQDGAQALGRRLGTKPIFRAADPAIQKAGRLAALAHVRAAEAHMAPMQNAPELPEPSGTQADPHLVLQRVKHRPTAPILSLFAVLQAVGAWREGDTQMASFIKRLAQQMQMQARDRELDAKKTEIKGNKTSATTQFAGNIAAFILSATMAAKFGFQDPSMSQFVSGGVNLWDKLFGGAAEANTAILNQKSESNTAQQEQVRIDLAGPWYDKAEESRKNAAKALEAFFQRITELVAPLWRNA